MNKRLTKKQKDILKGMNRRQIRLLAVKAVNTSIKLEDRISKQDQKIITLVSINERLRNHNLELQMQVEELIDQLPFWKRKKYRKEVI